MPATEQSFQPSAELEKFRRRVLADPVLLQELRRTQDADEFINASVHAAQRMGLILTHAEMQAALRAARGEWIERWAG